MAHYVAVRYGSNGANQPLTPSMVLGVIQAKKRDIAQEFAEANWTCYNNQHISLEAWSEATYALRKEAEECEVFDAEEEMASLAGKYD